MEKDEAVVKIQKLIYGGNSIAKIDNYPLFIPDGCPDDVVKIKIAKKNKSYGIAKIQEIITPSKNRVKPFCPLHSVCGGCGLQHIKYEEQLKQKQNIVKETIEKIYGKSIPVLPVKSPKNNKNYRYKVQYPITQTKVSKRIIAGYYKNNTHEAINIKYCPVQPSFLDEITEFIRNKAQELKISGYDEKKHIGLLRHVIYRVSKYSGKVLIILVLNSENTDKNIKKLVEFLSKIQNITGVLVNFNTKRTNVIIGENYQTLFGKNYIEEKIGSIIYHVSANSFFQVNPESAEIIFNTAKEMINQNVDKPSILDAYSGVSAFGLQMSDIASEITCVEECKSSVDDAIKNIEINKIKNITVFNNDASETFASFVKQGKSFDVVLLDPPRKGCSEKSLDFASKLAKSLIIYVSCNPSSLARDLKYLEAKGFIADYIQPVDMFCHTPHIENVVLIRKQK